MGRRERPLDPDAGPVQRFAHELRSLRQKAGGPTYREMARRANYSVTALSQAAAGDRLPSLPVALAYVRACDGDPEEWERRWHEAAGREREEDGDESPYQGLARFEPDDHERFFGRAELVGTLVRKVRGERFTAVFGPSGSGKSSLLRAGLIPALRSGEQGRPATIRVLTPRDRPVRDHARLLRPSAAVGDTIIVVDQFEEVFTLCHDPAERAEFIDLLLAARAPDSRLRVVIAVRADFYGRCAEHRPLADALTGAGLLVGPMSAAELREVVVRPAQAAGLQVERELTERLVTETDGEPGGLPLLSHVLRETWLRRRGRTLTTEAYEAAGGVHGAIAHTAEEVYGALPPGQAEPARRLLLRLVAPGEQAQDTRRPVGRAELDFADPADLRPVLDRLSRARLITLDDDTVQLAHEALITAWPRLSGWLDENRERLRVHRRLTEAARAWADLGRDAGALYRGTRLALAEARLEPVELTSLEREFLAASRAVRAGEGRRRRLVTGVLAGLVALALIAATVAWRQSTTSHLRQVQAEARRIAAIADGVRFSDPVTAMRLSVAAWRLADTEETRSALVAARYRSERDALSLPGSIFTDEGLGVRHLNAAGNTVWAADGNHVRVWDVRTHRLLHTYPGLGDQADDTDSAVPSPDGRSLALVGFDELRLRDVRTGRTIGTLHVSPFMGVFGPSGRTLAVALDGDARNSAQVWDVRRRKVLLTVPFAAADDWTEDLAVSPDDRWLALCSDKRALQLWDIVHRREVSLPGTADLAKGQCREGGGGLAFAPDGRTLAVVTGSHVRLWDVRSRRATVTLGGGSAELGALTFSHDGRFLAGADDELLLWRLAAPAAPVFRHTLAGETAREIRFGPGDGTLSYLNLTGTAVRSFDVSGATSGVWWRRGSDLARLSRDGRTLAVLRSTGGTDRPRYELLDARTGRVLARLPGRPCTEAGPEEDWEPETSDSDVAGLAVATSGEGSAGAGGGLKFVPDLDSGVACVDRMAFSGDGRSLAYTTDAPRRVVVVDVRTHRVRATVGVSASGLSADGLALSEDGDRLLVSEIVDSVDTTLNRDSLKVWDLARAGKPALLRTLAGFRGSHLAVADGTLVSWQGTAADLTTGRVTPHTLGENPLSALAFSPDGTRLAVGDMLGRATVWDGALGSRLAVLSGTRTTDATGPAEGVSALAFSADGSTLAVAGAAGTIRLWDVDSGQQLGAALPAPGDPVLSLAFSPDGGRLYASGLHAVLRSYALAPDALADQICARAGGGLGRAAWRTYLPGTPYRRTC
jgi:WD40 repeat protein